MDSIRAVWHTGLGLRTKVFEESYYYADEQCQELAEWYLKQNSVLKKSVTIQSSQLFHLVENNLVTITLTDKPGNPVERHLVTGFTRPIGENGEMTIDCTSVNDFPVASPYPLPSTLTYATLAVTVDPGAVVTCSMGGQTLTAVSTGVAVFELNSYGEWTITARTPTKSGETTADIDSPGLYTIELTILEGGT